MTQRTREELDVLCNEYAQETQDVIDRVKAFLEALEVAIHTSFEGSFLMRINDGGGNEEFEVFDFVNTRTGEVNPQYTALARLWEIVHESEE